MSGYRYVGSDRFYGIPIRDLSADEFVALDPEQRRKVRRSPAYAEIVPTPPAPPKSKPAPKAAKPSEGGQD